MANLEYKKKEGIVFPVSNTVLLPGAVTAIQMKAGNDARLGHLKDANGTIIALP